MRFFLALAVLLAALTAPSVATATHGTLQQGQLPAACLSWNPWFCYSSQYGASSNTATLDTRNAEYYLAYGESQHWGGFSPINDCRIRMGIPAGVGNTAYKGTAYSARVDARKIIADIVVIDSHAMGYCRYRSTVIGSNNSPWLYGGVQLMEYAPPGSGPWSYTGPYWY